MDENIPNITVHELRAIGHDVLDKYEVMQVFTGGGMELVYRVHHRDWAMDVAIKSPRPEYFQTQQHIENFEREAATLAAQWNCPTQVRHQVPNLVTRKKAMH